MFVRVLRAGLLIRITGDTIALSPPLIIERKDVDRIFETLVGDHRPLGLKRRTRRILVPGFDVLALASIRWGIAYE